jgi:hypothetical protein
MLDSRFVARAPLIRWRVKGGAASAQTIDDLLAEAADDLTALAVVHCEKQDDQASSSQSSQRAIAFDQKRLGTFASGCYGGGNTGCAATHDEYLRVRSHWRPPSRFFDEISHAAPACFPMVAILPE